MCAMNNLCRCNKSALRRKTPCYAGMMKRAVARGCWLIGATVTACASPSTTPLQPTTPTPNITIGRNSTVPNPVVLPAVSPTVGVPGNVLEAIVQISVGLAHVCAVTATHEIVCWGDNSAGQLGLGRNMRTVAGQLLQPHVVGGLPPMTQVAAGAM